MDKRFLSQLKTTVTQAPFAKTPKGEIIPPAKAPDGAINWDRVNVPGVALGALHFNLPPGKMNKSAWPSITLKVSR